MPDTGTVRVRTANGSIWNIPAENLAKAIQRGAMPVATPSSSVTPTAQPATAAERFATQAVGLPESTASDTAGRPVGIDSLAKLSTWLKASRDAAASLNPYAGHGEAAQAGMERFAQPGVMNKVNGTAEWLASGLPFAGAPTVRSMEQVQSGDLAGGLGSAINAATLARLGPEATRYAVEGPLRRLAQNMRGVGGPFIEDAVTRHNKAIADARADYAKDVERIRNENKATENASVSNRAQAIDRIQEANAKALADYRTKVAAITAEFQAGQAALAKSTAVAGQLSSALPQLEKAATAEAKAMYPKVGGTVDAAAIRGDLQSALGQLRGTERAPASIARILDDIKSTEATAKPPSYDGNELNLADLLHKAIYDKLKAQGAYTPEQIAQFEGAEANPVPFDKLHGFVSEIGRELGRSDIPGDERAALASAYDKLGRRRQALVDAEGKTAQFDAAQENWKKLVNTFRNTDAANGSPIAKALATADPVTGQLNALKVRRLLASPEAFEVAQQHLARYQHLGVVPPGLLDSMRQAVEEFKSAPKRLKLPNAPEPEAAPPQESPAYKPPPSAPTFKPFDPVEARRAAIEKRGVTPVTPSWMWHYSLLRSLIQQAERSAAIKNYLSQNPR